MTGSEKQLPSTDINKRILKFIEAENLKLSELADILDVPRSRLSHIKSGRNKPNIEFVIKLLTKFPHLNPDWLLLGQGSMYKKSTIVNEDDTPEKPTAPSPDPTEPEKPEPKPEDDERKDEDKKDKEEITDDEEKKDRQTDKTTSEDKITESQPSEPSKNKPNTEQHPTSPTPAQPFDPTEPERILILFPDHTFITYRERKNN